MIDLTEYGLSKRAARAIRAKLASPVGPIYAEDLIKYTEAEMLRLPNFGKKSLKEVKKVLAHYGLALGDHLRDHRPN